MSRLQELFSPEDCLAKARALADHFVDLQTPFGRPDPGRTPFARPGKLNCGRMHAAPIFAETCYQAFDATGQAAYLDAADRLTTFVLAALRNPTAGDEEEKDEEKHEEKHEEDWYLDALIGPDAAPARRIEERNQLARSWQYGMALACYADFKAHHRDETCFDSKAEAVYRWLQHYRWDRPSTFRVGYARGDFPDNGFSDDLSHVGRGLIKYYRQCGREVVLADAAGLATYLLAAAERGSDAGVFHESLGTWAVSPWPVIGFEHMDGVAADGVGWGFSARGATLFLLRLYPYVDELVRRRTAERCLASLRWQFETCQFEDGALGIFQRDDKWLGMTAGAVLNFIELDYLGLIGRADRPCFGPHAAAACRWLFDHAAIDFAIGQCGYEKATGQTDTAHRENAGWLVAWAVQALLALAET